MSEDREAPISHRKCDTCGQTYEVREAPEQLLKQLQRAMVTELEGRPREYLFLCPLCLKADEDKKGSFAQKWKR